MGVSYYACQCCGDSRYEEYVGECCECGKRLGTCCVINDDIGDSYAHSYGVLYDGSKEQKAEYNIADDEEEKGWVTIGKPIDDVGMDSKYCPFCAGEKVDKEDVVEYLLQKCGMTFEEAKREYLKLKQAESVEEEVE